MKEVMTEVIDNEIFGTGLAHLRVVEFQKWGLRHAHCIFFFIKPNKENMLDPEQFDTVISAEIKLQDDPVLHKSVVSHMIHGTCGKESSSAICMKEGFCTKGFAIHLREKTGTYDDVGSQYYFTLKRTSPKHHGEQDFRRTLVQERTSSFHKESPVESSWVSRTFLGRSVKLPSSV